MGRLNVAVVRLDEVEPITLDGGGWSRVTLTGGRVGSATSLGVSSFAPGTATAMLTHSTEELAHVVAGRGELRLVDRVVPFDAGSSLFIPSGVAHVVAALGDEPVRMVFSFAHPEYPPTTRQTTDA